MRGEVDDEDGEGGEDDVDLFAPIEADGDEENLDDAGGSYFPFPACSMEAKLMLCPCV